MDEEQFARRLADAVLRDPSVRPDVLAPPLRREAFQEQLDAMARQVSRQLGPDYSVVSHGPGRAAVYGLHPYGLFYHRDAAGLAASVEIYPLSVRRPGAWLHAPWYVLLILATPLLPAAAAADASTLISRAMLSVAALALTAALWVNSRWDVVGVRLRPAWAALVVLAVLAGWLRGAPTGTGQPIGVESIPLVIGLLVGLPTVLARRRSAETVFELADLFPAGYGAYVVQGGASVRLNHHFRHAEQRWALDVVPVCGPLGRNPLSTATVAVSAPVGGRVVTAVDGLPDRPAALEAVPRYGNHIVIEHIDALGPVHVYLCHLAQGSLRVAAGDVVAAGQPIGSVGDSGRSTEPHLHLHGVRPGAYPVLVPVPLTVNGRQLWRSRLSPAG